MKFNRFQWAAGLCLLAATHIAAATMATPGQFSVSELGAAIYTIPIQVPPGVAGMTPKLALSYNSQSGNGLIGLSWSMSGLSAITRCPHTIAQDGVSRGIANDQYDRFCLDGDRLMVVSGEYGSSGSEYRTERESFAKVTSHGQAGNGVEWFQVLTKSGEIMEYGRAASSRIEFPGSATARVWALNKVQDTKGNYFTVTYNKDAGGDFYPQRIDYTGNGGAAPTNAVQFSYEPRPDVTTIFQAGTSLRNTVRLTNIASYENGALTKDYQIRYDVGPAKQLSRVRTIADCDAVGACLPPVGISWDESAPGLVDSGGFNSNYAAWATTPESTRVMDVDGDGRSDIVLGPDGNGNWYVLQSTENGFVDRGPWITGAYANWSGSPERIRAMDVNADGKHDIVIGPYDNGQWFVLESTGSSFIDRGSWLNSSYGAWSSSASRIHVADVDGDGRQDIVMGPQGDGKWFVLQSNGSAFVDRGAWISNAYGVWATDASTISRIRTTDLDGDGKSDFLIGPDSNGTWHALQSAGNSFVDRGIWKNSPYGWTDVGAIERTRLMDANGDGLQDVVMGPDGNGNWYVMLSTGAGFEDEGPWLTGAYANWTDSASQIRTIDINSDGKQDIMLGPYDNGQWFVLQSTGSGFTNLGSLLNTTYGNWYGSANRIRFMDLDGHGKADIVLGPYDNGQWFVLRSNNVKGRITTVGTNLGTEISIAYTPITAGAVYTKGTGATYPKIDLQFPMYVVSSFSATNGIGGSLTTNYTYGDLRASQDGRGLQGFGWIEAKQVETGLITTTDYLQDWPYTGLPSRNRKIIYEAGSARLLGQSIHSYSCTHPASGAACTVGPGQRYFPYVSQTSESSWDVNGAALPVVTSTSQYDNFGNPTQITVATGDGHTKTTTNSYVNDPVNWFLGRLQKATVTSTTP